MRTRLCCLLLFIGIFDVYSPNASAQSDNALFLVCDGCGVLAAKRAAINSVGGSSSVQVWVFDTTYNAAYNFHVESEPNGTGGYTKTALKNATPSEEQAALTAYAAIVGALRQAQTNYDSDKARTYSYSDGVYTNLQNFNADQRPNAITPIPIPSQVCGCTSVRDVLTDDVKQLQLREYINTIYISKYVSSAFALITRQALAYLLAEKKYTTITIMFEDGSSVMVMLNPDGPSDAIVKILIDTARDKNGDVVSFGGTNGDGSGFGLSYAASENISFETKCFRGFVNGIDTGVFCYSVRVP